MLGDGVLAARVAAERAELWTPGALAWITFLGWITPLAVVTPAPSETDLTFLGAGLVTSGAWPLNAVAIGIGIIGALSVALVLGALGQAALQLQLRGATGPTLAEPIWADVGRILVVRLIAAVPSIVALVVLLAGVAAVVADEFQSPDIGGSVAVRIGGRVLPLLVLLGVAALVGLPLAAAMERRVIGPGATPLGAALRSGVGDLLRSPVGAAVVTVIGLAVQLVYVVGAWLLLRVLWAPIAAQLRTGIGIDGAAALLLVGFVAIWLCLVLGGGALRAWVSAWWTLQLAAARGWAGRPPTAEGIRSA